jgi:hypothetical protein
MTRYLRLALHLWLAILIGGAVVGGAFMAVDALRGDGPMAGFADWMETMR